MSENSTPTDATERSREELLAELELLEAENQELYDSYVRAKRTQYRRTAAGLLGLGVVAALAGVAIPTAQSVLLSLAGIGLFGGVLTLFLTPERFIAADTGQNVYAAMATNEQALVTELGLTGTRIYVPTDDLDRSVALFVPQSEDYVLPDAADLTETIVAPSDPEQRGVAFEPSGARLFESFTQALSGPLGDTPGSLGSQLTDALTTQFELVEAAEASPDTDGAGLTVTVSGSAYGPLTRFDHPVASFVAVGVARGLERPVELHVTEAADDRADYRIRVQFDEPESQAASQD
jgi:hypothetical protein